MLWERLEILLMPQLLVLRRASINRWRHGGIPARSETVDQAETSADWRVAVAALGKVLAREARHGTRVHIALSDLWVRSHLMPATSTSLSEDEMLLLARTHFAHLRGEKMAAYLVVDIDVTNPAQFEEYKKLAPAAIAKYGGRYLIRGGAYEAIEGDWKPQRLTVVEFDSMEKAKAFYHSPEYQVAIKARKGAANMKILLVQGI